MQNNRRPSRSTRRRSNWNSSMVGTHHRNQGSSRRTSQGPGRQSSYAGRRRSPSINGRVGEVSQVRPNVREMDRRTASMNTNRSRTEEFMARRRRNTIISFVVAVIVVLFAAFSLGSCAFKGSISGAMALDNGDLKKELTAQKDGESNYILLSGISNVGQNTESVDYLAILRVDKQNNKMSVINIPTDLAVSSSQNSNDKYKNLTKADGEAALVKHVVEKFGIKINHYLRIDAEDFPKVMDAFGGLTVDVTQRIDDPEVSSEVITTGPQTLKGDKILTFVKASNFNDGFVTKTENQKLAFEAFMKGITTRSGLDYMGSFDAFANAIKTDMSVDQLEEIFEVYRNKEALYYVPVPTAASVVNDQHFSYLSSSKWSKMSEKFTAGDDPTISIDTSGVDKNGLSIIVYNASGIDGFAAQVTEVLTGLGYPIQETGNYSYQDFPETLVVYKENHAAAEAIVEDLGVGRAIPAGFNYTLTSEIQVMVGKDWKPKN